MSSQLNVCQLSRGDSICQKSVQTTGHARLDRSTSSISHASWQSELVAAQEYFVKLKDPLILEQIKYVVEGTVQGVNYRAFARRHAHELSITGWAKNEDNETVAGEAQGSQNAVDKFVQHLRMGPSASHVTKVEHENIDTKSGEQDFKRHVLRIRHQFRQRHS